jgi:hypothetical protein
MTPHVKEEKKALVKFNFKNSSHWSVPGISAFLILRLK